MELLLRYCNAMSKIETLDPKSLPYKGNSDLNLSQWAKTFDVSARLGIHNVPFIVKGR